MRQRLIDGQPLNLNADANWNHRHTLKKKYYLDDYMAKNLYYITAITDNRPCPEGEGATESTYVLLAPAGQSDLPDRNLTTTDPSRFWAAPKK